MINYIKSWFSRYKNYLLVYKDGFWDVPYLSNSPETIITSIIRMPFTKHAVKRQSIRSNTPLIKGTMFYEKVEEGLYLIHSEMTYKANINYKSVNDRNLNSDWYLLSLTIFQLEHKYSLLNGELYTNATWLLFKPNAWASNCHFKGTEELSFTFYFNEDWLKRALSTNKKFKNNSIRHFLESDAKHIMWPAEPDTLKPFYGGVYKNFHNTQCRTKKATEELKIWSYELIDQFLTSSRKRNMASGYFDVPDRVRKKVYKTEQLLLKNLTREFIGINKLAKDVGISETYLKQNFKLVFGKTIFQYFKEKQMSLAKEILLKDGISISELARVMGYENVSKFSSAFKKQIGSLPSKLK